MKRVLLAGSLVLFMGCSAQKHLATSVAELAGNPPVAGWVDQAKTEKKDVFIEKNCLKDSDKDGVVDALDKCPDTPKGLEVNHFGCPIITTLRFNFDFNKAKIKSIYIPQLEKIAKALKANPKLKIEIDGYTDDIGSKEYNLKLSKKRAEAVKNFLVKKYHISPDRIIIKGFGEAYPLVPNTTSTNRAINRRVEIIGIENNRYLNKKLNTLIN